MREFREFGESEKKKLVSKECWSCWSFWVSESVVSCKTEGVRRDSTVIDCEAINPIVNPIPVYGH
jgi:hypothetical protein